MPGFHTASLDRFALCFVGYQRRTFVPINGGFSTTEKADSLLLNKQPIIALQVSPPRIVTRKKKGIAGFFGSKENVQLPSVTTGQNTRSKKLISLKNVRQREIETYMDSLRLHNKELNRKLRMLITSLNEQISIAFQNKEERLEASYNRSIHIITWLVISAIVLLAISYLIIQKDLREKARTKKRLEETVKQNAALLKMRKNIILTLSHEIRTPLNIVTGNVELAIDSREKKQRNIYLKNIGDVCLHVVHLLNNLLEVYLLNEANERRKDVPFNLHEMLERTAIPVKSNNFPLIYLPDLQYVCPDSLGLRLDMQSRPHTSCLISGFCSSDRGFADGFLRIPLTVDTLA